MTPFIISYDILQTLTLYLTIHTTKFILKAFNPDVFVIGDFLSYNETYVKFIPACAAASAYFLLLILTVLTKDIKFKIRLKIFFTGALIVFAVNILRIIVLIMLLEKHSINLFRTLHLFLQFNPEFGV